jgi:peptidoglycan lytic transglycosylase
VARKRGPAILAIVGVLQGFEFPDPAIAEAGRASWYELTSRTASGEICDPHSMTAAHRSLPFGTWVRVENLESRQRIIVRINDRGPYADGRIIDLTIEAARKLGIIGRGVANVRVTVIPTRR